MSHRWMSSVPGWLRGGAKLRSAVTLACAAALPAGVVFAVLSAADATEPRFFPSPPVQPSPWLVAPSARVVPDTCQITALVVDDGSARADVPLRLVRVTSMGPVDVWSALSDSRGAHRFVDLPQGHYQLTALVEGRAPASSPSFRCGEEDARAFFTLGLQQSEHVVVGRVTSSDGSSIAGAELAFAQEALDRNALAGTARVQVAADGRYSVRLVPGRYVVLVQAPFHAPLQRTLHVRAEAPSTSARYALTPAPHVTGRVVDENGAPVAGALVAVGGIFDPRARVPTARSETDGTFDLPVSLGQDVLLTARGGGRVAQAALGVVQRRTGVAGVELVVRAGRRVEGIVMTPDGASWAFGTVRYRVRALGLSGVEKVDGAGRFALDGMPLDADVEVWAEGNATGAWGAQLASPGRDQLALVYTPPAY